MAPLQRLVPPIFFSAPLRGAIAKWRIPPSAIAKWRIVPSASGSVARSADPSERFRHLADPQNALSPGRRILQNAFSPGRRILQSALSPGRRILQNALPPGRPGSSARPTGDSRRLPTIHEGFFGWNRSELNSGRVYVRVSRNRRWSCRGWHRPGGGIFLWSQSVLRVSTPGRSEIRVE